MHKLYPVIDPITNEVVDKVALQQVKPSKWFPFRKWFAMNQVTMSVMKTCKRSDDFRVLFALLEIMDKNNEVRVFIKEVAQDLAMYDSQVSAALRRLRDNKVIVQDARDNRLYRVNQTLVWRGHGSDYEHHAEPLSKESRYVA